LEVLSVRRCHIGSIDNRLAASDNADRVSRSARHDLVIEFIYAASYRATVSAEKSPYKTSWPSSLDDDFLDA
jgi:hypothetical protein